MSRARLVIVLLLVLTALPAFGEDFWKLDFSLKNEFDYRVIAGGLFDEDTQNRLFEDLNFWGYRRWGDRDMTLLVSGKYVRNFEDVGSDSILYDITDTYMSSERFEPQQIYLAVDKLFDADVFGIKLGRQFYYGAEPVRFDGGYAYFQDPGGKVARLYGYAGSVVSYYDSDPPNESAWGAGLELLFIPGNKTYAELFRFLDYVTLVGFNQKIFSFSNVSGEYRMINGYPSDASAELQAWSYRWDSLASLFYRGNIGPRDLEKSDLFLFDYYSTDNNKPKYYVTDESYYYQDYRLDNLNFTPLEPYWEVGLTLEKGFINGLLRPGVEYAIHRLSNNNDEDYYNFSYDCAKAWVNLTGLPLDEFSLALGFELNRDMREKASEKIDSEALFAQISAGFLDRKLVGEAGLATRTYHYQEKDWAGDQYSIGLKYNPFAYASIGLEYESLADSWYQELAGTNRIDTVMGTLEVKY